MRAWPILRDFRTPHLWPCLGLRNGKFGLLPSPKLKDPVAFCIDSKANHGELTREGLLKMLAIPGLNVKNTFLIQQVSASNEQSGAVLRFPALQRERQPVCHLKRNKPNRCPATIPRRVDR